MNLIEISIRADGEAAEAVSELFNRLGKGGAIIEELPDAELRQLVVKTYLLADDEIEVKRRAIEQSLWHLSQLYPIPPAEFRELKEADWANAWKSFHPVQHLGERIVLKPTWREYQPQPHELVIELDPGMAFGTGQHPSTRLCLLALERHVRAGMRVLDVGTGSGILAILAAKLGASEVFACDIDPVAVDVARENIMLNQVSDKVHLGTGSLGHWDYAPDARFARHTPDPPIPRPAREVRRGPRGTKAGGQRPRRGPALRGRGCGFGTRARDLLLINILAPVIIDLLPVARPLLHADGHIILSGLIATQEADVRAAMRETGFQVVEREQEGDWVMLVGHLVA